MYLVDIALPTGILFENVIANDANLDGQSIDLVIGIEILSKGDLAITNYNGKTELSFRYPSKGKIDFTECK